ncbi:MAG: NUDIX domain-containing protein [archaeon]
MEIIHKIAAMVITDDKFLMVRKKGKDIWTNLGGKPEGDETEDEALIREIKEELDCDSEIVRKLGDFEAKAVFDDAVVRLSVFLVKIIGEPKINDPELEEFRFISKDYKTQGIKLPPSIEEQILPYCLDYGILKW